jgi:hypothetical protein
MYWAVPAISFSSITATTGFSDMRTDAIRRWALMAGILD